MTGFAAATAVRRTGLLTLILSSLLAWAGCTPPPSEERVVAFVNGKPITKTEFDHEGAALPDATKTRYEKEGGQQAYLKELIDDEILLQEARKLRSERRDSRPRAPVQGKAIEGRAAQRPDEDNGRADKGRVGQIL